jgi:ATP-dependent RNA helicase DOB1
VLQGAFHDLSPPDVAAVCSCLVNEEKDDTAQVQLHEVKAREVVSKMRECAQRVRAAKMEAGLAIREEEESAYNTSLMDAVHMWCSGASFADVCARSKMFEGRYSICLLY